MPLPWLNSVANSWSRRVNRENERGREKQGANGVKELRKRPAPGSIRRVAVGPSIADRLCVSSNPSGEMVSGGSDIGFYLNGITRHLQQECHERKPKFATFKQSVFDEHRKSIEGR